MLRTPVSHWALYSLVLLSLLLSPLTPLLPTPTVRAATTAQIAESDLLFRTHITLQRPTDQQRLSALDVAVLERSDTSAVVLVDNEQLKTLARLRFQPRGTQALAPLVTAHASAKPWLAQSLQPLLAQAASTQALLQAPDAPHGEASPRCASRPMPYRPSNAPR